MFSLINLGNIQFLVIMKMKVIVMQLRIMVKFVFIMIEAMDNRKFINYKFKPIFLMLLA